MGASEEHETELRVAAVLEAAREHATGVSIERLTELLPESAPGTAAELQTWLRARPGLAVLGADGRVRAPSAGDGPVPEHREARAEEFSGAARWLVDGPLRGLQPLLRCAVVTGSVAYGEPDAEDDCDLMLVSRSGGLWLVAAWSFVRLRLLGRDGPHAPLPNFCLNYLVDEDTAREEFGSPRGFLFAREAMTVRPIFGEAYYRSLLAHAVWLRTEVPRLYARWAPTELRADPGPPAPWAVRVLNAALYPGVAAYLQFKGLYACHGHRRDGEEPRQFHTVTRPKRMALLTRKFERLRSAYAGAPAPG